jgi:hypothetical protein
MKRYCCLILLSLATTLSVVAQETADSLQTEPVIEDSASFVQVGMLVAEPSYQHPQSSFGHAFLRMQCPSEGLDYCFSMESGDYEGFLDICLGNYPNRLVCIPTEEYITSFNDEGRCVTEYPLNLRLEEAQRLWRLLDETCASGSSPYHDFFHHGCSQELVRLLVQALDGSIELGKASEAFGNTILVIGNQNLPADSWLHLTTFLLTTDGTDRQLSPLEKTLIPCIIPSLFSDARVVEADGSSRQLLQDKPPRMFSPHKPQPEEASMPLWVWFALLLAATLLISFAAHQWKCEGIRRFAFGWDVVLFVAYNTITFTLLILAALSTLPTLHGWNWNFLLYNPLPLVLWLYSCWHPQGRRLRVFYRCYAVWTALFIGGMLFVGDHQILEQYLLALCFGSRCLFKAGSYPLQTKQINNNPQ